MKIDKAVASATGLAQPFFGRVRLTPSAAAALAPEEVLTALTRHALGDWGNVTARGWRENEDALEAGYPLFSIYPTAHWEHEFWVITTDDRSSTTVLMPSDY